MKATYKSIKLNYNGEIKRLALPKSFKDLQELIPRAFHISPEGVKDFTISYLDDEEDRVLISNEFDYQQATIFIEKANISVLKIFISDPEKQLEAYSNFEVINEEEKEKSHRSIEKVKGVEKSDNISLNHEDVIVQSMNEMRLSTDFAKSEIFSQDKEFVIDSHGEECNDLVKNIEEKLNLKTESKEFLFEAKENFDEKIEDQKLLGKKTSKEFNFYEFLIDKIKEVPPFEAMIDYIIQKRSAKQEVNSSNSLTVEKAKRNVRNEIAKAVRKQLKNTEKKILSSLYTEADKEVERLFQSNILIKADGMKNKSTAIHVHVRCDGCRKKPIEGSRFKCSICEDFDFCEECEEKNKDNHPHPFIKIRKPELQPTKIVTVLEENHSNQKLNTIKEKVKNYAGKYMQFTENVTNDLQGFIAKIKTECPKLFNELKPSTSFYEMFDCRNIKDSSSNEKKISQIALEKQPEIKNLSSRCLTANLVFPAVNNSNEIRKSLKLVNNGSYPWPRFCYFTCLEDESSVKGRNVPVKIKVDPGQEINIELVLNLKQIKEDGVYQSIWQLQNEKRENFGEKIVLKIDAQFPKDLMVDIDFRQESKEVFPKQRKIKTCADLLKEIQPIKINQNLSRKVQSNRKEELNYTHLMNQLKSDYNLNGIGDNKILYALVRAKGNTEMALDNLFSSNNFCDYHPKHFD